MEYDKDKVDEMTLALLYIVMSQEHDHGRAWKGFDWGTMHRFYQKRWIPKIRLQALGVLGGSASGSE